MSCSRKPPASVVATAPHHGRRETTVDLQRLDDLIPKFKAGPLARAATATRRAVFRLTARRFTIEIALAKREIEARGDELHWLDERVRTLRERCNGSSRPRRRTTRKGAWQSAAAEAQRTELLRLALASEHVQQIRSEMAVVGRTARNAMARRQRAELEANRARRTGDAVLGDAGRRRVSAHSMKSSSAGRGNAALRQRSEDEARQSVAQMRAALKRRNVIIAMCRSVASRGHRPRAVAQRDRRTVAAVDSWRRIAHSSPRR